jgi:hypothetical protein
MEGIMADLVWAGAAITGGIVGIVIGLSDRCGRKAVAEITLQTGAELAAHIEAEANAKGVNISLSGADLSGQSGSAAQHDPQGQHAHAPQSIGSTRS